MTLDPLFARPLRCATLALVGLGLALAPAAALAQTTAPKPAAQTTAPKPAATTAAPKAEPAKPAVTKAAVKAAAKDDDEDDTPSSAAQKKACDANWKVEKEKSKTSGWKAYFTFMSKCM